MLKYINILRTTINRLDKMKNRIQNFSNIWKSDVGNYVYQDKHNDVINLFTKFIKNCYKLHNFFKFFNDVNSLMEQAV